MTRIKGTAVRLGFTLIELSIVLVIIGLIVGGILVGRDLIAAAGVRAQISQIEKYQQAVSTFHGKYGYLPGDIPNPEATKFGFKARGNAAGQGDGNWIISGYTPSGNVVMGEISMFWVDLSTARLIDGNLNAANANDAGGVYTPIDKYMPRGKIGSNFVYVYSGGYWGGSWFFDGYNYFGLSAATAINTELFSDPGLTVTQARAIDSKMDEGTPQGGKVTARYMDYATNSTGVALPAGGGVSGASGSVATAASATTCYDNNNVAGATQQYSITQNNGGGMNCALSFKFQ